MAITKREYMVADVNDSHTIRKNAASAITDVRCLAMKYDANGNVVVANTKGEYVIGIAIITNGRPHNDAYGYVKAGDGIDIQRRGTGSALSGGVFAVGTELTVDANGKLIAADSGDFVIAIAEQASKTADSLVVVDIVKMGYKA